MMLAFCISANGGVVDTNVNDPTRCFDAEDRQARAASTPMVIESSSQLQKERSPLPSPFNEGKDQACAAAIAARSIRSRGTHAA
jgi:hypothetical protein